MLRLLPALTLLLFLGPVIAGVLGTLLPAFGYLPAIGGETLTLEPWRRLLEAPGLATALRLTLTSGIGATVLAFVLTVAVFAAGHGTRAFELARRGMTPLLAVPHLAVAVGLAFVIAPSGWIVRLISPWPSGFALPPDVATVRDPYGIALTLGLVIKETPFLVLVTFAALGQVGAAAKLKMARSLGYGPVRAWLKVVLPLVYPQIRLPVYAVLAYSLSVVDMAIVLGPGTPPPLAPMIFRWFNDPDLAVRFVAAAGAVLQLALVVAAIAVWRAAEVAVAHVARSWLASGGRGGDGGVPRGIAWSALCALFALAGSAIASLFVWSITWRWRFPDVLPSAYTGATWTQRLDALAGPAWTTLAAGLAASLTALVLVAGCLENESVRRRPAGRPALTLIYVPLLVPQIGFLFGVQVLLVRLGLDGTWAGLIWAHLLFVLPYVFLALADPYRSLDARYARIAQALGKPPWVVWMRIKLGLLLRPVLVALAIGFAVSAAQFLPTLFAGGGRFATLTTEALSLAASGNRRIVGMLGFTLAILPLAGFALAVGVPAWRYRNRRALAVGA